ncbi:DUF3054 domain-containing protein [Ruania alba]|uniref:DUF3054 domain-containing protein n=1 Tax=Ruania alba TaxID=648782 RepID=A0A1H5DAL6_9MICO|nr:DUF3054 domain-containing protein [Ruania alba]SED75901.1 Protein of unknown function [Ruania alba]
MVGLSESPTAQPVPIGAARPAWSAEADLVAVLVFVVAGRGTHHETVLLGALGTAWPFLVALVPGWALARAWRAPVCLWPTGVIVWLVTAAGGLALRGLTGGGLSGAFPLVTVLALGGLMVGWRAAVVLWHRFRR